MATATLLKRRSRYRCLLNLIAALPHPLLNTNSSQLSLCTTAPFAALKKVFGVVSLT